MSILIIRHGETAGNANRVVQRPDTPLSERGLAQAAQLGTRLAESRIGRILASDYARAAMTAESLSAATGIPVVLEPLLRERNFGELRGRRYDDLEVDLFGPDFAPPGGEDWPTFHERVDRAWSRIRQAASETADDLAVVTHGLVLGSLATRHLALDDETQAVMGFGNTSVTIVDPVPPWRVWLLNCTAHLDAPADPRAISGI